MAESRSVVEALRYLAASIELFQQFRDPLNCARVLRNRSLIFESDRRYSDALGNMKQAFNLLSESSYLKHTYEKEIRRLTQKAR